MPFSRVQVAIVPQPSLYLYKAFCDYFTCFMLYTMLYYTCNRIHCFHCLGCHGDMSHCVTRSARQESFFAIYWLLPDKLSSTSTANTYILSRARDLPENPALLTSKVSIYYSTILFKGYKGLDNLNLVISKIFRN